MTRNCTTHAKLILFLRAQPAWSPSSMAKQMLPITSASASAIKNVIAVAAGHLNASSSPSQRDFAPATVAIVVNAMAATVPIQPAENATLVAVITAHALMSTAMAIVSMMAGPSNSMGIELTVTAKSTHTMKVTMTCVGISLGTVSFLQYADEDSANVILDPALFCMTDPFGLGPSDS